MLVPQLDHRTQRLIEARQRRARVAAAELEFFRATGELDHLHCRGIARGLPRRSL